MCASLPDPQGYDDGDDDNDNDDAFMSAFDIFTGDEGEELSEVGMVCSAPTNDNWFQPYYTTIDTSPRFHCSLPVSAPFCHFTEAALAHVKIIIYDLYEQQRDTQQQAILYCTCKRQASHPVTILSLTANPTGLSSSV